MSNNLSASQKTQDISHLETDHSILLEDGAMAVVMLGDKIREIRTQRGWTIEELAQHSKLDVEVLRMIEDKKTSPSVFDLQRLARVFEVPIVDFFESVDLPKPIVLTPHDQRPEATCCQALIQNLGKGLKHSTLEPFVVTMPKNACSGGRNLIHGGYEFAYCLKGKMLYLINEIEYKLAAGDSLLFAASIPHRWENIHDGETQFILVLTPIDFHHEQSKLHFLETEKQ